MAFVLLLAFSSALSAQPGSNLLFRTLSIEQGLSQNSVLSIARDRFGFLWFGTESGLNKFDGYHFTIYIPIEGDDTSISNSWINALLTDSKGRLWIGTENGLNRYAFSSDEFIRYFHNPDDPNSLSSSRIFALYEDRAGNLWVGTDQGLNLLNHSTNSFKRYAHDPANPASLSSNQVRAIAQDHQGFIWVGTFGGGLNRLNPTTGQFTRIRHNPANPGSSLPDDYIMSLLITRQNGTETIWIGTNNSGLVSYNPATNKFRTYRRDPKISTSITDNSINCLVSDTDGMLWIGTNAGGLCRFNPDQTTFICYQHNAPDLLSLADNRVVSLYLDPERILWIGTYRGISQLNLHRQNFRRFLPDPSNPSSLSNPAVRAFCEDSSGNLLVGTDGGGLDIFDRNRLRIKNFRHDPKNPKSISSDRIYSMAVGKNDSIWIGSINGGLNLFHPSTSTFTRYLYNPKKPGSLIDDRVRSLLVDSKNRLWIGSNGLGLIFFDEASQKFLRPKISKIINLKAGELPPENDSRGQSQPSASDLSSSSSSSSASLSSGSSASSALPVSSPVASNPLLTSRIFSMAQDHKGYLWLACFGDGLVRYSFESGEIIKLMNDPQVPQSLSNNFVTYVYADHNGYVWAGTNGGGLNRLDTSNFIFTRYTESQGLPSSVIYGILEDDKGYIWISSNRGLSRLDPRTNQVKNFDTTDGLQSYEFNGSACYKGRNGFLYFGGINGFNAFHPGEIKTSTYLPPVIITNFLISNVPVKPGHPLNGQVILKNSIFETQFIELKWQHRVIGFEFASLDYTCPEKNQYAYILEGFDQDWNYVGTRRFASYSNLPPGRYTFRVKASNSDGVWNEIGTSLSLRVIPPFWRTWWFYTLLILAVIGAVYGFVRFRLEQAKQRQRELEYLVAQRTEELRLANDKLQFLATTDELTGLANYRRFREFLDYEWRRAYRNQKPISLIICDLDNFKLFNDTYGHQAGDECLRRVACAMNKCCLRSTDLASRYGGDEFAVVLPDTDAAGALIVAERIRQNIGRLDFSDLNLKKINSAFSQEEKEPEKREGGRQDNPPDNQQKCQDTGKVPLVTICLGLATMSPIEGGNPNDLIARADGALYRAKTSGKNRSQQ
ncbi:MAG: two-component regulator propeller domain-containing protein [Candidatus Omnitrophica bacterium]|nr:two-component regulator propeller domain-containing protein [Candidatus Omnitrophota bacterium]